MLLAVAVAVRDRLLLALVGLAVVVLGQRLLAEPLGRLIPVAVVVAVAG